MVERMGWEARDERLIGDTTGMTLKRFMPIPFSKQPTWSLGNILPILDLIV